jgi:hypothetical protein
LVFGIVAPGHKTQSKFGLFGVVGFEVVGFEVVGRSLEGMAIYYMFFMNRTSV